MNETLDTAMFLVMLWSMHAIPIAIVAGPIWFFGRRRVHWRGTDFAIAIIPFALWVTLMWCDGTGKSLANVVEGVWLGCLVPLATIIRLATARKGHGRIVAAGLLFVLCLVAAGLWHFMPALPE